MTRKEFMAMLSDKPLSLADLLRESERIGPVPRHFDPEPEDLCFTCKGRGTVNPFTAPAEYFCVSTTTCPDCDGSGYNS